MTATPAEKAPAYVICFRMPPSMVGNKHACLMTHEMRYSASTITAAKQWAEGEAAKKGARLQWTTEKSGERRGAVAPSKIKDGHFGHFLITPLKPLPEGR